jgi:hypothetical protein
VIGDGYGRHLPPRGLVNDLFEVAGSIQQAVIRVQVQVNESGGFHAEGYSNRARNFLLRHDCSDSGKHPEAKLIVHLEKFRYQRRDDVKFCRTAKIFAKFIEGVVAFDALLAYGDVSAEHSSTGQRPGFRQRLLCAL